VYETDAETIDLDDVPLNGGVLVKILYLSVDPYMRGRMRDPSTPSYSQLFELGQPLRISILFYVLSLSDIYTSSGDGAGIVKVLRTESPKYKVGDQLCEYVLT